MSHLQEVVELSSSSETEAATTPLSTKAPQAQKKKPAKMAKPNPPESALHSSQKTIAIPTEGAASDDSSDDLPRYITGHFPSRVKSLRSLQHLLGPARQISRWPQKAKIPDLLERDLRRLLVLQGFRWSPWTSEAFRG